MSKITLMLLWAGMAVGGAAVVRADGPVAATVGELGSDDHAVAVWHLPDANVVDGDSVKWKGIGGLPALYSKKDQGSVKLGWREDGLYGFVQVKDDTIQSNSDEPWTGDCLELWLETDDAKADAMSTCSMQIELAPDPQAGPGPAIVHVSSGSITPEAVKAVWKATANGYAIEFFIPAKELQPAAMRRGSKIGFHYSIDQKGTAIEQFYCEKDTDSSFRVPRNWGTIQLAGGQGAAAGPVHQGAIAHPAAPAAQPANALDIAPAEGMILYDVRDLEGEVNLARQSERLKDWDHAAERYEELIERYGSRAMPATIDEYGQAVTYGNFGHYLQECISRLPADGLATYRGKFDSPAKRLLESAGGDDLRTLDRVCSLYFCTPSGKEAAMRMMALQMDAGEFGAAGLTGDRLLEHYPELGVDRPMVLFRTGLAWCYGGDASRAADRAAELRQKFPTAADIVRGRWANLADALDHELAAAAHADAEPPEPAPPIGGILSVARPGHADVMPGRRLYRIALDAPPAASVQPREEGQDGSAGDHGSQGRELGIIPSIAAQQLFFQDGKHLFAVDLAAGVPLRGWRATWPKGVFTLAGPAESSRGHQLTVTLTDRFVLAIMGQSDRQTPNAMPDGEANENKGILQREPTLVCLDRDTGALRWNVVLSKLPDSAADARTMQMIGSPMVLGSEVLVTARGESSLRDEEKAYVLAFDLRTGKSLWCTFIGGHAPRIMDDFNSRPIPVEQAPTATQLAYADGMVFVQSNLGALAALDPWDGQIRWLDIFPIGREEPKNITDHYWAFERPRPFDHQPWAFAPVVVSAGRLFTMPAEGQLLHICDPLTGREIKRLDLARLRRRFPDPGSKEFLPDMRSSSFDTLVAISGNRLIVSSARTICCIDWPRYRPASLDAQEPFAPPVTLWAELLPTQIRGRPYLTGSEILVPCEDRLYRLSIDTGNPIGAFPSAPAAWSAPDEPGNVIATEDRVVIAGTNGVNVYEARATR